MQKAFWLCALLVFHCAMACDVVDDRGHALHLDHPAERVISLSPDLTNSLVALGASQKIIGRVQQKNTTLDKVPVVATYHALDLEKIMALHPDLIVLWGETHFALDFFKTRIPIYESNPHTFSDIAKTLRHLGCLTGQDAKAEALVRQFETRYALLRSRNEHKKPIRVFYELWDAPLTTITSKSWISEAVAICGGQLVFSNLYGITPIVDPEAVLSVDPDVILGRSVDHWKKYTKLKAVKTGNLINFKTEELEKPDLSILNTVESLCNALDLARSRL